METAVHDPQDQLRVAHARHPALGADVGRDALQRHHRARAGFLGDFGVLGGDHIHDHAALEHLRQPRLDPKRPNLSVH